MEGMWGLDPDQAGEREEERTVPDTGLIQELVRPPTVSTPHRCPGMSWFEQVFLPVTLLCPAGSSGKDAFSETDPHHQEVSESPFRVKEETEQGRATFKQEVRGFPSSKGLSFLRLVRCFLSVVSHV